MESPLRGGDPSAPLASGYEVAGLGHGNLSDAEREVRRTVVRQLLALGVPLDALPRAMGEQGWPMARGTARAEYEAVLAEWVADHAAFRESTRVAQVRRLEGDLARYRAAEGAEAGTRGARTRWQAIVQTEALLARLQGHLAPTQVEVRVDALLVVRDALAETVAGLSPEDVERLLDEEAEREQLLAEARRDRGALVVRGEPAGPEEPRGSSPDL